MPSKCTEPTEGRHHHKAIRRRASSRRIFPPQQRGSKKKASAFDCQMSRCCPIKGVPDFASHKISLADIIRATGCVPRLVMRESSEYSAPSIQVQQVSLKP